MKNIACELKDKKENKNRTRHILANSGLIMESGEVRDLDALYVMGRDGNLIKISELKKDNTSDDYMVKAMADHEESTTKQFGGAKVWLEKDGLHARIYFGENSLADHLWGISEYASYSTGIDWYIDGYYGAGLEVDEPIGILREISVVQVGNDPRAKTIDHKHVETKTGASGSDLGETKVDGDNIKNEKETLMAENVEAKKDELTPDESTAMKTRLAEEVVEKLAQAVDEFTTKAPESEVQPTEKESVDEVDEAESAETKDEEEKVEKETKDTLHNPVVVIRDRAVKQERTTDAVKDYLKSEKSVEAWGRALIEAQGDAKAWRDSFKKIAKKDGVDFGENVSLAPEAVVNAVAEQLNDEDTLFSHVNKTGLAFEIVAIPTEEDGAVGHKNGETKIEENISGKTRVFTPADIYKLMKLDHSMVKLNGGLTSSAIVKYVLRELPRKLVETIDKAILVGGVKNEDGSDFTALNAILADIADTESIYGSEYEVVAGDNLRQTISKASNRVLSSTDRSLICTPDFFADLENATTEGGQLLFPSGINKGTPNINGLRRIITPLWLTDEMLNGAQAVIVDLSAYHTVGDSTPENFTDYDIDVNKYVWEAVACVGGGLANKNSAVAIKGASVSA